METTQIHPDNATKPAVGYGLTSKAKSRGRYTLYQGYEYAAITDNNGITRWKLTTTLSVKAWSLTVAFRRLQEQAAKEGIKVVSAYDLDGKEVRNG